MSPEDRAELERVHRLLDEQMLALLDDAEARGVEVRVPTFDEIEDHIRQIIRDSGIAGSQEQEDEMVRRMREAQP